MAIHLDNCSNAGTRTLASTSTTAAQLVASIVMDSDGSSAVFACSRPKRH